MLIKLHWGDATPAATVVPAIRHKMGPEPEPEPEPKPKPGGRAAVAPPPVHAVAPPPIQVYVRVRPLTAPERESSPEQLDGLALESSSAVGDGAGTAVALAAQGRYKEEAEAARQAGHAVRHEREAVGGFAGILGQEAVNRTVFDRCFAGHVGTVLRGGAASFFSYGYTGGGKTHTVVGYGEERGMYYLAAERLLSELAGGADDALFLRATACEIYNDKVYDLLGEEKVEMTLRMDEAGQLVVQGAASREQLEGVAEGPFGTVVTRTAGLRAAAVHAPEHLQQISTSCVTQRTSGTSTEHKQSSRSHAILRMEVVSAAVLQAQEALQDASARLPALKGAADNVSTKMRTQLYCDHCTVLRDMSRVDAAPAVVLGYASEPVEGDLRILDGGGGGGDAIGSGGGILSNRKYALDMEGDDVSRTADEWAAHLGRPLGSLVVAHVVTKTSPEGGWDARKSELDQQAEEIAALLSAAQVEFERATAALAAVIASGPAALGGSLLVVDLAGADYDHRAVGKEQRESTAINKSLLALKECFRCLANPKSAGRPPFRDSKLTRMLEDSLAPKVRRESLGCITYSGTFYREIPHSFTNPYDDVNVFFSLTIRNSDD